MVRGFGCIPKARCSSRGVVAESAARPQSYGYLIGYTNSSPCPEMLLDLVHQRVGEPCLPQFGKVFKHNGLPRLSTLHIFLVAVLKIQRPRLVLAGEKHQRVS